MKYESSFLPSGTQMGRFKIEDYSGSTELVAFGKHLMELNSFCQEGLAVCVRGVYKKNFKGEIKFNITQMQLLDDVKGKLIKGITLKTAIDQIKPELRELLKKNAVKKDDKRSAGTLAFRIYDPSVNREIMMTSSVRIPIERHFIDELRRIENIEFSVEHV